MIHEELTLSPFERAHFGRRNEFVFRRHESLPDDAARTIRRRAHPAWSQMRVEYRVSGASS
jgi:hypothetical protein